MVPGLFDVTLQGKAQEIHLHFEMDIRKSASICIDNIRLKIPGHSMNDHRDFNYD